MDHLSQPLFLLMLGLTALAEVCLLCAMSQEAYLLTAIGVLASCIGVLFLWFKAQFAYIVGKLEECETDREKLWEFLINKKIVPANGDPNPTFSLRKNE